MVCGCVSTADEVVLSRLPGGIVDPFTRSLYTQDTEDQVRVQGSNGRASLARMVVCRVVTVPDTGRSYYAISTLSKHAINPFTVSHGLCASPAPAGRVLWPGWCCVA